VPESKLNIMFINENLNPLKRKVGDCVIRSLAKALDKSWIEVYDDLCSIGRKEFCNPNSTEVASLYLKRY
jgi:hypothetical protein